MFYWILHHSRTPRIIILSPPRINPAGFLTQFSLPDSLSATKVQKQDHQSVHACLHVSSLSPIKALCSTIPLLPTPSLLLLSFSSAALLSSPFPLLSYPLVAIAIAVAAVACSA